MAKKNKRDEEKDAANSVGKKTRNNSDALKEKAALEKLTKHLSEYSAYFK